MATEMVDEQPKLLLSSFRYNYIKLQTRSRLGKKDMEKKHT